MILQLEYFANSCEYISDSYLHILRDTHLQENLWFEGKRIYFSSDELVEDLLRSIKHLFSTSEYKYYKNNAAMSLLNDLFHRTKSYYTNIETASRMGNRTLLNDPKWIEIQNISKKTEEELKKFITYLRLLCKCLPMI